MLPGVLLACALLLAAAAVSAQSPDASTGDAAVGASALSARFQVLHTASLPGLSLLRSSLAPPARYRVLLVPGSGCDSLAPSADRLAAGLLHAQVVLLQKPHLRQPGATAAAAVAAAADDCPADFVRADALPAWADTARQLAAQALQHTNPKLPLVLVGLSEGAELLPTLAAAYPQAVLLVLVGHAGLDPAALGSLQARRSGQTAAWQQLQADTAPGRAPQDALLQGRHWRYWQALWTWPLAAPLLAAPQPLLQVWGADDALLPQAAFEAFRQLAQGRAAGYCGWRFDGADHQLRSTSRSPSHSHAADHLRTVWAWLENAGRSAGPWLIDCQPP